MRWAGGILILSFISVVGWSNDRIATSGELNSEECALVLERVNRLVQPVGRKQLPAKPWVQAGKARNLRGLLHQAQVPQSVFSSWVGAETYLARGHRDPTLNLVLQKLFRPTNWSPIVGLMSRQVELVNSEAHALTVLSPINFRITRFADDEEPDYSFKPIHIVPGLYLPHQLPDEAAAGLYRHPDLVLIPQPPAILEGQEIPFQPWLGTLLHQLTTTADADLFSLAIQAKYAGKNHIFPVLDDHLRIEDGWIELDETFFFFLSQSRSNWNYRLIREVMGIPWTPEMEDAAFDTLVEACGTEFLDRYGITIATFNQIRESWSAALVSLASLAPAR